MLDFLYNVFIQPVESIVEFIFYFMDKVFPDRPEVSILFLSLAINFLILPLYKRADDMQEQERAKLASMDHWIKHIRKTFKGDERYMMQSTYYRIEGYKPLSAVAGSLSLLFQIPFFIAAYHFISNLDKLNGRAFYLIPDLGAPDGILKIAGLSINILPIIMTFINILSGAVYTKGFKLKDKLQLYIIALLFLALLYTSPSGLVMYWTCNNLFSLGKNIVFKYGKKGRIAFNVLSAAFGTAFFVKLLSVHRLVARRQYFVFGMLLVLSYLPMILSVVKRIKGDKVKEASEKKALQPEEKKNLSTVFWLGALFSTVLFGVMIPAQLIGSSPTEFGTLVKNGPLSLVLSTFALFLGYFIVWIGIFFLISKDVAKRFFANAMWILCICSLINYYLFFGKFGTMDYLLRFDKAPVYSDLGKLINMLVLIAAALVLFFVLKKLPKVVKAVLTILVLMVAILSADSMIKIHKNLLDEGYYVAKQDTVIKPTVPISRDGKNIIVVMLDRAMSEYVPYIFKERPEIAETFEDFVYYPNTISFGGCTNFATPSLFGGYEYTPAEMNKRDTEPLAVKHTEALRVLPVIFAENGYDVNVLDPPYANYNEFSDVTIFDDYENITAYITRNKYAEYEYHNDNELTVQKKHLAFYSLFRTMPVLLQNSIYDEGNYLIKPISVLDEDAFYYCAESYALLDYFDEYTYIEEGSKDKLLIMSSMLTHEPTTLEMPNYTIKKDVEGDFSNYIVPFDYVVNGRELYMSDWDDVQHYHVNVASYRLLAKYFEYLKKEGIYDNTRIILVSDHGWPLLQTEGTAIDDQTSLETFNPLLLVKDFADSDALIQGEVYKMEEVNLKVCDTFMTNADVAVLCTEGVIDNPVNPFTGNPINNLEKTAHDQLITTSGYSSVSTNNGNTFFTGDFPWMTFKGGDVRDLSNWTVLYPDKTEQKK